MTEKTYEDPTCRDCGQVVRFQKAIVNGAEKWACVNPEPTLLLVKLDTGWHWKRGYASHTQSCAQKSNTPPPQAQQSNDDDLPF